MGEPVARAELGRDLYCKMLQIRRFEEMASRLFTAQKLPGFLHLSIGQEAVAAGVCAALRLDDVIATTHRGHGHCLAKGAEPRRMMAELFGRREGYSRGVGGSMHIADLERGILGANGIVGASIAVATGAAYGFQIQKNDRVAVAFFGEGAANEGIFHEALNLAALWHLPAIYLCENNGYAEMTPEVVHRAGSEIAARAAVYGIPGYVVDGTDAFAIYDAVQGAAAVCRAGQGPILLEARTNRWHGHFEGDRQGYRSAAEIEQARQRDPIEILRERLLTAGWTDRAWLEAISTEIDAEIAEAVTYGSGGSPLDFAAMMAQVYCGAGGAAEGSQ